MGKKILLHLTLFLIFFVVSKSQDGEIQEIKKDTIEIKKDTIFRYHHTLHGSLKKFSNNNIVIDKKDFYKYNYLTLSDIIYNKLNVFKISSSALGQFSNFSIYGSDPRDNQVYFNGRNITDNEFGMINLEQLAVENLKNIEIYKGSEAAILGASSGLLINLQENIHNTSKPFTRFWFIEAGYETLGADATYSHNLNEELNFTFDLKSLNTLGKYENAWSKSWNVCSSLRYSPDDYTSFTFSEYYTNQSIGMNGGVDTHNSEDIFDHLTAYTIYRQLNERTFRHDLNLGMSSILSKDTSNLIHLNLFYTHNENIANSGSDFYFNKIDSTISNSFVNSYFGFNGNYAFNYDDIFKLKVGGDLCYSMIDSSYSIDKYYGLSNSLFGTVGLTVFNDISLHGGIRIFSKYGLFGLSYGAGAEVNLLEKLKTYFDISLQDRIPTPSEGLNLLNEKQYLLIAGAEYKWDNHVFVAEYYLRRTDNNIMLNETVIDSIKYFNFINQNPINLMGINLSANIEIIENLYIKNKITLNDNLSDTYSYIPLFTYNLDINYLYKVFNHEIQGGLDFNCFSSFNAQSYNPLYKGFILNSKESGFMTNGIDAYINLKISSAIIKATFSNLLGQKQYFMAYYPIWGRNFRLSVAWSFWD